MSCLARLASALLALVFIAGGSWGEVAVVVNQEVEIKPLDQGDLRDFFLGKRSLIVDVQQADIVIQDNDEKQDRFVKQFVGITSAQFRTYWKKMVFTGQGKAPTIRANDKEVVEYIKSHRDAVGYIDTSSPHEGVRVLPAPKE